MENKPNLPGNLSMQEVLRMAATPAGQQLITMLRQQGGSDFQAAMSSAASGDYTQAKRSVDIRKRANMILMPMRKYKSLYLIFVL